MRYGIFSDTHSNLEAFQAVIKSMEGEKIDTYICGGDIVGYGADPSRCIELTRELTQTVVCGNHDWAVTGLFDTSYFNPYAMEAISWTAKNLNQSEKDYLRNLRTIYEDETLTLVHGSLYEPEMFHYVQDVYSAIQTFGLMKRRVCFIGHSHSPVIFSKVGDDIAHTRQSRVALEEGVLYIVNVGSVGQPRDGDPRACYAIFDLDDNTIELKRVPYNIKKAQAKILKAGLPRVLAERLSTGI